MSGEDIDDNDSLDQQKAKILFFDHSTTLKDKDDEVDKSCAVADNNLLCLKTDEVSEKDSNAFAYSEDESQGLLN